MSFSTETGTAYFEEILDSMPEAARRAIARRTGQRPEYLLARMFARRGDWAAAAQWAAQGQGGALLEDVLDDEALGL